MKLKASEIALLVAAVLVVGLIIYNFVNGGTPELKEVSVAEERVNEVSATRNEQTVFSDDPDSLRDQLKRADEETVKDYMREVLDRELPENYDYPQYLIDAGTINASVEAIGARFPEFYKKGGGELVHAVRRHPVKYAEMIEHTRAYRELYRYQLEGDFVDTVVKRPARVEREKK